MKKRTHSSLYQQRYKIMWLFLKYQLIVKTLVSTIVIPIYQAIIHFLIISSGKIGISSGDFLPFLFSFNGIGMLIISILMMLFLIVFDINTFIVACAKIREQQQIITAREMIRLGIKSMNKFNSWTGLIMMLYVTLIFPLLSIGIAISPMKNFQIPNFIMSVVEGNPLYFTIYIVVIGILSYLSYRCIFSFHYLLIENLDPISALKSSVNLIKKNGKVFLWRIFLWMIKFFGSVLIMVFSGILLIVVLMEYFNFQDSISIDFLSLLFFITALEFSVLLSFYAMPMLLFEITDLYYRFTQPDSAINLSKNKYYFLKKLRNAIIFILITSLVIIFNFGASYVISESMELEVFNHNIQLVAHRGGGDLGAENTLEGIQKVIENKVEWAEIDIQRTRDNHYVLNHDQTFKRLTGDSRSSSEMTLAEIKRLKVKNTFDATKESQPVPTIEEVIEVSKNNIGLFIELKGATADTKMVDDMVKLIKQHHIEKNAVLVSLDYKIIEYIEDKYPEILSGYIYYFSLGADQLLKGDFLIMEEAAATPTKVDILRNSGKKVIVWTVNTKESIEKFAVSNVDGIITDFVPKARDGIAAIKQSPDIQIFFQQMLNWTE